MTWFWFVVVACLLMDEAVDNMRASIDHRNEHDRGDDWDARARGGEWDDV